MLSIRNHYYGQLGRFAPFPLSDELLSGMANPSAVTPTGYQWIYVASPKVTDLPVGTAQARSCRHDVELELEMVPEVSVFLSGESWRARAAIAGGVANGGDPNMAGAIWSAVATISGGGASIPDVSVSGATWVTPADITGGAADGGAAADPYFPNVTLLLHMNGSNGGTTFVDDSNIANVVTAYNNAQISTAQTKWGVSSALFNGTGSYLRIDDGTWAQLSTVCTVEMWFYATTHDTAGRHLISKSTYGQNFSWGIKFTKSSIAVYTNNTNSSCISTAIDVTANTWHHVAFTNDPGTGIKIWFNGVQVGSNANAVVTNASGNVAIGAVNWNVPTEFFQGYIDEVRITKAVRYTITFTPPGAAFPNG
jgi:hypothetical protein